MFQIVISKSTFTLINFYDPKDVALYYNENEYTKNFP